MKFHPSFSRAARLVLLPLSILTLHIAQAGSATWQLNPPSGDWNTAANWTPETVPSAPGDTASFGVSNITAVSLSDSVTIDAIVFEAGASAFTITETPLRAITITGAGVVNNSGVTQNIAVPSTYEGAFLNIENGATIGSGVQVTLQSASVMGLGGSLLFSNDPDMPGASAGQGIYIGEGAIHQGDFGGSVTFRGTSTAGQATIVLNASTSNETFNSYGAFAQFWDTTSAADSTITCKGGTSGTQQGGALTFIANSTAGNATLIAEAGARNRGGPGTISFTEASSGGTARIELFGNGTLELTAHNDGNSIRTGSIEGDGIVSLGTKLLIVGGNNLSTTFSGTIAGAGGRLTKVGADTLTLSGGASTYTGGTTVSSGTLVASNRTGSATGSGSVAVNAGTLGGSGTISGAVTIGTGSGTGAFLAPAHRTKKQATLTIQSALTFQADATYAYTYKAQGGNARSDEVVASGVTINSGASFSFPGTALGVLPDGTILTVISNTSAAPIGGTFANLADGAILTVSGNNFQADYEDGDGNDLTLTVVP